MYIVPLYAAALALLFVFLSFKVIRLRRTLRIAIGDGNNKTMLRAIRVHANFAEYVPITLLLLFFIEMQNAHAMFIHGLCASLLIGRYMHAHGVSHEKEDYRFRRAGMLITFATIIASACYLLASLLWRLI